MRSTQTHEPVYESTTSSPEFIFNNSSSRHGVQSGNLRSKKDLTKLPDLNSEAVQGKHRNQKIWKRKPQNLTLLTDATPCNTPQVYNRSASKQKGTGHRQKHNAMPTIAK